MKTDLGQHVKCADCGERICSCPERQENGTWRKGDIETEIKNGFYRPKERSIDIYRQRHAPLIHIERETAQGFFKPTTSAIKAYTDRAHAAYMALGASMRRPWLSVLLALSVLQIAAQIHA